MTVIDQPRGESSPSVLRRGVRLLARSARTHPGPFAASVAGSFLFGVLAVATTAILGWMTDQIVVPGLRGEVSGGTVALAALLVVAVAVVRAAGVVARRYFGAMTMRRMQRSWLTRVVDTYLSVPLDYFGRHPTGELLAHAEADVEGAVAALQSLPFSLSVIALVGGSLASLAVLDPMLVLVSLVLFPVLGAVDRAYTARVAAPAALTQARIGEVSRVAHESFEGALVVKALGLEHRQVGRLAGAADDLRTARLRVGRLRAGFEPALDALPNLATIAMLATGAWRVSEGVITAGQLVQAMALFGILVLPVRVVGTLLEGLPRAVAAADRLDTVLAEPRRAAPTAVGPRALPAGPLGVEVRGLRFGYGEARVLDGLDLQLHPGESVVLVGATGAGKSTLCHLLGHLHPPDAGTVRLGGVRLDEADPADIRRGVAVAPQEPFLFAASVRENLTLGDPVSDDDIAWALHRSRADRFVAALPGGLDQPVGERGATLSGGQRQRLALARALLRRPGLLLLDDATAAVDPHVERQILDGLRDALPATTLLVAHRVSTIARAERVLFLEDGRVAATGTHRELLATVGSYAALAQAYERDEP